MEIEFDPAKNARNITDRGLSFTLVEEFDLDHGHDRAIKPSKRSPIFRHRLHRHPPSRFGLYQARREGAGDQLAPGP
jgi:hypothetical protein